MRNRFVVAVVAVVALIALILPNVGFSVPGAVVNADVMNAAGTILVASIMSDCEHPSGPCGSKTADCDIACPLQALFMPAVDLPAPRPVTQAIHYPAVTKYGQGHIGSPSAPPPRSTSVG